MNILWITNIIFPDQAETMNLPLPVSGGWMYGLAEQISNENDIELAVATVFKCKRLHINKIKNITYYIIPYKESNNYPYKLELYWKTICSEFKPDIIHIHGTEYAHGLACMNSCPKETYIISIQGILAKNSKYLFADIKPIEFIKHITFKDILKRDNTIIKRNRWIKASKMLEQKYYKKTKSVIGRTRFDFSFVKYLNKDVNYYFCNESLRIGFYNANKWNYNSIKYFTIFVSQSDRIIKGLHKLLEAISLLREDYPKINCRIAGNDISSINTFTDRLKLTSYGSYIRSLIIKNGLSENVCFLGLLKEEQMIKEYQNAHVFICPSSIENSPNSLGEAQLIGTPVIASYVGGIPDMVTDGETGLLYRFEETEMLAESIRRIFNDYELTIRLSQNGIDVAKKRHNRESNLKRMLEIYSTITKK